MQSPGQTAQLAGCHRLVPLLLGLLGLSSAANATWYTYDPQAAYPDNNLQALCDLCSTHGDTHTGIQLEGDWNQSLVITNARSQSWVLEGNGHRIAEQLWILDSTPPAGQDEARLTIRLGWIGLDRGETEVQDGSTVTVGAANVELRGVTFLGQDRLESINGQCQRVGSGSLMDLQGHATSSSAGDPNSALFAGSLFGSVDVIDCIFDFRFEAVSPCLPGSGYLPEAVRASNAKLRVYNPGIPSAGCRNFSNGFLLAQESLVHLAAVELEGLQIVSGATTNHPAALLTASGTLLEGGTDVGTPPQILLLNSILENCGGGEAGVLWSDGITGGGDYGGVQIAGTTRISDCFGTRTGAIHIESCKLSGISGVEFSGNTSLVQDPGTGSGALSLIELSGTAQAPIEDCHFFNNSTPTTQNGGAITLVDCAFALRRTEVIHCPGPAILVTQIAPRVFSVEDVLIDANFVDPNPHGLVLSAPSIPGCVIRNLLMDNYTYGAKIGWSSQVPLAELLLDGITIWAGFSAIGITDCAEPIRITNTNLDAGIYGIVFEEGAEEDDQLHLSHVNLDDCVVLAPDPWFPEYTQESVTTYSSGFVGTGSVVEKYQLRWNSPLLDIGTGTGNGNQELLDYDFDYTPRDIGYKRRFPVIALGETNYDPPVGWYTVPAESSADVAFAGAVPHGSVYRVGTGAELHMIGGSEPFHVGDPEGERTVLVSRDPGNLQHADVLRFSVEDDGPLEFHGTKLNGMPRHIEFHKCTIGLDGQSGLETVEFDQGPGTPIEVTLYFERAAGQVSDFDFRRETGSDLRLRLFSTLRSSVSVDNCQFSATHPDEDYTLVMEGKKAGVATLISDCTFDGSSDTGVPIRLLDSQPRLENNLVHGVRHLALSSYLGAFTMDHTARNRFLSEYENQPPALYRLLFLHDSPVYLECGENAFVYRQADVEPVFDYIFYKGKEPFQGIGQPDWKQYRLNFWGTDCSTPLATTGRIPSWAVAGDELPMCPAGNPLVCGSIISGMLSQGQAQEEHGNAQAAAGTYESLMSAYPESPEALSAAQRLKAIAFSGQVERDPEDLQALAGAVDHSEGILPAYLMGAAECLRAWQGDRPGAETNLLALMATAQDESESAVAAKNLLEIATYPASGGLSRHAPADTRVLRDARRVLLAFDSEAFASSGSPSDSGLPGSLELHPAYPNPFNPGTTIRLHLDHEAPLELAIWNLAGQKVAVLHQGRLAAGGHEFQWQAHHQASGVYLLRATTPGQSRQQKLLLIK
jgi:hypothetical protein